MKRTSLLFAIILFFSQTACSQVKKNAFDSMVDGLIKHTVQTISVEKLHSELENENVVLLDSREKKEFDVSHLPNAKYVGYDQYDFDVVQSLKKDQKIVVYCSVGYRSEKTAEKLKKLGFTNVYNLYGGIFDWVNHDFKVVNKQNKNTNRVHAYSKSWGVWLNKAQKVYN